MDQSNEKTQKRVPIRRRVTAVILLTTLVGILAAAITGLVCIGWVKNSSEAALTEQLENNLKYAVQQKAVTADAKLEHYEKYIEFVTDYIEGMYANEKRMVELGHVFYAPKDTKEYMLTRAFAKESMSANDFMNEILFFSNLEQVWDPIVRANEDLITTVYAGTTSGLLTSYDRWSYISAVPDGQELIYDYFESDWYKQGVKESGTFFTGLYVDSQGRGLTITVASPFRNSTGQVMGVNSADFDITGLYNELLSVDLGEGTFSFTLDKDGAIISPDAENQTIEEYTGLSPAELDELKAEPDNILEKGGSVYVCVPIERVGWTLCASIPRELIQERINDVDQSIQYAFLLFVGIVIFIVIVLTFAADRIASTITRPMEQLGRDIKIIADGNLNYRATVYRNDEIGDITDGMNEMVDRLNATIEELSNTQRQASALSKLATQDALTGIRNKTAYDRQILELEQEVADGQRELGLMMIDLNDLKAINDAYGHDKGDSAIIGLCTIICDTFVHSPVFRVGGDEFVVILKGHDYQHVEELVAHFKAETERVSKDQKLDPWNRISAAIGYALYDEKLDDSMDSLLARADQNMYECKRAMKQA